MARKGLGRKTLLTGTVTVVTLDSVYKQELSRLSCFELVFELVLCLEGIDVSNLELRSLGGSDLLPS